MVQQLLLYPQLNMEINMQSCDHDFEEVTIFGDKGKSYQCIMCAYTYRDDPYQSAAGFINRFGLKLVQHNLKYYEEKQNLCYMDWILTEEEVDVLKMLASSCAVVNTFDGVEACERILSKAPEGMYAYSPKNKVYFSEVAKQYHDVLNFVILDHLRGAVEHVNLILSYKDK